MNEIDRRALLRGLAYTAGGLAVTTSTPMRRVAAWAAVDPIVETSSGKIQGFLNDDVRTFRGIRYGAPTGGKNRFMPPQKPEPWAGIHDATSYGYSAPQTNPATRGIAQPNTPIRQILDGSDGYRTPPAESEDCLFLNIWTRGLGAGKRPVMMWLHGGGFSSGSASSLLYDGTNLARRGDVVVVGVNHRLNAFGYTHFGDIGGAEYAHSGNAGMLDIILALEWVRDNIERFGGDPKRVMIFGESGGGSKVSMLMASPPAKGLFHRAVIESGPGVRMSERDRASRAAEALLAELDLDAKRLREIHKVPTDKVLTAYFAATARLARESAGSGAGFQPVLDPEILPGHPFHPAATRISEDVPLVIGWNKTEATLFSPADELFSLDEAGMRKRIAPLAKSNADVDKLIEAYRRENPKASPSEIYFYAASYSMMGAGSVAIAERKAALGKAPAFVYRFEWRTPVMNGKFITPHGLEMPFVFDNVDRGGAALTGGGDEATRLAARISEAWIAFAATGSPNTSKSGLPAWEPYDSTKRSVMILNNKSRLASDPLKEERLLASRGAL